MIAQCEADLVLAAGDEVVDQRQGGDVFDRGGNNVRLAGGAGDEQVQVADRVFAAAKRACGRDDLDAGVLADERTDAVGPFGGRVDAKAAGILAVVFDAFEDLVDLFLAEAG